MRQVASLRFVMLGTAGLAACSLDYIPEPSDASLTGGGGTSPVGNGGDAMSWRLEGTNDATLATWTTVDTRMGQTFAGRFQTNTYSFTNTTAYAAYRFFVTANAGAAQFQIAEIQLF